MTFISYISGFSKMFVALTLLSLGNSLGDLFVDSALSKQGCGTMAITGVFSGQLLNLLIGFSLNLFFSYLKGAKTDNSVDTEFHLFNPEVLLLGDKQQFMTLFVMGYTGTMLLVHIVSGISTNFVFSSKYKFVGIVSYLVFLVVFVMMEVMPWE